MSLINKLGSDRVRYSVRVVIRELQPVRPDWASLYFAVYRATILRGMSKYGEKYKSKPFLPLGGGAQHRSIVTYGRERSQHRVASQSFRANLLEGALPRTFVFRQARLAPEQLRVALDKNRPFELLALLEFENPKAGIMASWTISKHGAFVCYGPQLYGVSDQRQIDALDAEGVRYNKRMS